MIFFKASKCLYYVRALISNWKLSTQERRGCCMPLSTVSPMPSGGPAHSRRSINILDEGSGNGMDSEFSMSCHRARLDTVFSSITSTGCSHVIYKDVDKYHHPVNTWLKE